MDLLLNGVFHLTEKEKNYSKRKFTEKYFWDFIENIVTMNLKRLFLIENQFSLNSF